MKQPNDTTSKITLSPLPAGDPTYPGAIRLRTFLRLRWMAVLGQAFALLFVQYYLNFPTQLGWCLAVIAMSVGLNIFLTLRARNIRKLSIQVIFLLISYDILQLCLLLALTGGLNNPFAFFLLIPVTIGATTLPQKHTISLCFMTIIFANIITFVHFPLPWKGGIEPNFPILYDFGIWAALVCSIAFASIYAYRIARESRDMSLALAATELALAREQHLSELDGLAAAAAHELGTPLSTIYLIAKELQSTSTQAAPDGLAEDIDLLQSQADRCREILSWLSKPHNQNDTMFITTHLSDMLNDIIALMRDGDVEFNMTVTPATNNAIPEPILPRNPGIKFSLRNLLNNAADFAAEQVMASVQWDDKYLTLTIMDDGPGFSHHIIDRLGDPYVTTQHGLDDSPHESPTTYEHDGMGLGIFIAYTLLERSGAIVTMKNRDLPATGAHIIVRWNHQKFSENGDASQNHT